MSKLALLIAVDNPSSSEGSTSELDARDFGKALQRFWSFEESEIVYLTSSGSGDSYATRQQVEKHFEQAFQDDSIDYLIVGFWGRGVTSPADNKRRYCLADYDPDRIKATTVSLGSLLSATIRLRARNACMIFDCRPMNADGEPWTTDEEDCRTIQRYIRKTEPGFRCAALASCSPGQRPMDDESGNRGLFTAILVEGMGDCARRFQGSFDSVAGYTVQNTSRKAQELGGAQFPFFVSAGDGDIRYPITQGLRVDEQFEEAQVEETEDSSLVSDLDDEKSGLISIETADAAEPQKPKRGFFSREGVTWAFAIAFILALAALIVMVVIFLRQGRDPLPLETQGLSSDLPTIIGAEVKSFISLF